MTSTDLRRFAPATLRNREPIVQQLQQHLPASAQVLEIASGTGEHALYFSEQLAQVTLWQPTDINDASLLSIQAWRQHALEQSNSLNCTVAQPVFFDVCAADDLPAPLLQAFNVIVAINLIHISPWEVTQALMRFAAKHLPKDGLLYLYGPYWQADVTPAVSNLEFDALLKQQNPAWGIRDLQQVLDEAQLHGLYKKAVIAMPANNMSVIFSACESVSSP